MLDLRIVKVTILVNGVLRTYTDLMLTATGVKYANALQNECEVTISNLDAKTKNLILTETTPYNLNRTPKTIVIEAGRESYGTSKIFVGNIVRSSVTQPPDVTVTLRCVTGAFLKGEIIANNLGAQSSLQQISQQVANDLGVTLRFEATNKQISNYNFTGASLKQIDKLNSLGVNAYLDDDVLVVKDVNKPLAENVRAVDSSTGLVGVPEITELGVRVKLLLDNTLRIGGLLRVKSEINPAANGEYSIFKLNFEITNRDEPFYYVAQAMRFLR